VASELPYGFWHRYVLHRNDDGWHYDYAGTLGAHAPGGR
jgi:hypothetical protein